MTKNILFIVVFAIILSSCKKSNSNLTSNLGEDNGCIERIDIPVTSQTSFTTSDYNMLNSLFVTNGVFKSNYRYTRTYTDNNTRLVHTLQYTSNLPIFNSDLNYAFTNGIYTGFAGKLTNGTSLNTIPTLRTGQIRKLFIDDAELYEHKGLQYKDTCLKAEFGYYNLHSDSYQIELLVKAWKVTLKSSMPPFEYPIAFYQDNGQLIYYFNGIEYLHH